MLRIKDTEAVEGPGILMIFIAVILVAIMMIAIIIGTIGGLIFQTSKTSRDVEGRINTQINVLDVIGDRHPNGLENAENSENIELIILNANLLKGSKSIELDKTTIKIIYSDTDKILTFGGVGTPSGETKNTYIISVISDDDNSINDSYIINSNDLIQIYIDVGDFSDGISESTDVELNIFPSNGKETKISFMTPHNYDGRFIPLN